MIAINPIMIAITVLKGAGRGKILRIYQIMANITTAIKTLISMDILVGLV
jgi:hypothetical protein